MKYIKLFCLIIFTSYCFSGCATALHELIEPDVKVEQTTLGTYVEGSSEEDTSDAISEENSSIEAEGKKNDNEKGIGESFNADVSYKTESGTVTRGTTGLKYTLNSVNVFNTFWDSGEDIHACDTCHIWDEESQSMILDPNAVELFLPYNNFIVIEMTATYIAPEGGKDEIDVRLLNDVLARYKQEKMPEGWLDEFIELRDQNIVVMEPIMHWFSEPILEEDGYDLIHDGFCFKLKDGEARTFKIGVYCWYKFVEYKNVYLSIQHFDSSLIEGYDGRYFALFPDE